MPPELTASVRDLIDTVESLSLARDLPTIQAIVRSAARRLSDADGATFVLRDGERCFYADEDAIEPLWKGQRFPLERCVSGWVMRHGQPAVIPDIYADDRVPIDAYRPTFVKSLVMVPIRSGDPIGAIGTYWATPRQATPGEIEVLRALADSTAIAIEHVRVLDELESRIATRTEELHRLSVTDPLTGVLNRRGFVEAVDRLRGAGADVALLFLDLDGLKAINDRLGHDEGDRAIVTAARTIEALVGPLGVVGRWGGDELVAAVTGPVDEREIATALDAAGVRCSVGATVVPAGDERSTEALLVAADEAMYAQKRSRAEARVVANEPG